MVDFNLLYKNNKAYSGDLKSMCELASYFSRCDKMVIAAEYLCLLVEHKPEVCEAHYQDAIGITMEYEKMLALICAAYYDDNYLTLAYRWLQKYIDYMDYNNLHREPEIWKGYRTTFGAYKILKDADELDKPHNRFKLKWERDILYFKHSHFFNSPTLQPEI